MLLVSGSGVRRNGRREFGGVRLHGRARGQSGLSRGLHRQDRSRGSSAGHFRSGGDFLSRNFGSVFRPTRRHLAGSSGQRRRPAVPLGNLHAQRWAAGDGAADDRGAGWRGYHEPSGGYSGSPGGDVLRGRGIPSGVFQKQSGSGVLRVRGGAQAEEVPREVRGEAAPGRLSAYVWHTGQKKLMRPDRKSVV